MTSATLDPALPARRLKIDVVVHGRFHAFHLARALLERGHDVRLLTNYPVWAVRRFGLPGGCVVAFPLHGILVRLYFRTLGRLGTVGLPTLHRLFGRWAARKVRTDADMIYVFSGVAEEILIRFRGRPSPQVWVVRGSAHILEQNRILRDERTRVGVPMDLPSPWTMAREVREYALATRIVSLSTFARESFASHPALAGKVILLRAAVDATRFRPTAETIAERIRRIEAGERLRVLNVGSFSFQKGARDLLDVANALHERMDFRFVGTLPAETRALQQQSGGRIELVPRVPEFALVDHYAWADVFLFPTLQDGSAAVLAQAQAAGLVVVTTPNSSGPDLVAEGVTGWIVPIRDPAAMIDRLSRCDADRGLLAGMVRASCDAPSTRQWSDMAADVEAQFGHERDGHAA